MKCRAVGRVERNPPPFGFLDEPENLLEADLCLRLGERFDLLRQLERPGLTVAEREIESVDLFRLHVDGCWTTHRCCRISSYDRQTRDK